MIKWSYSLMDRMADSGSAGLGSIPGGTTFFMLHHNKFISEKKG